MKNLFPTMFSRPKSSMLVSIAVYWGAAVISLPMGLSYWGTGLWEDLTFSSWMEIGYHILNGAMLMAILKAYLKDEWFMVTTDPKYYLGHAAVTVGLMAVVLLLMTVAFFFVLSPLFLLECLPVTELSMWLTPGYLAALNPVFGTMCMVLFSPVSVCGLYYAIGFAPLCCKRPWLAYINVAVITLLPALVDILWRGDAVLVVIIYLIQLPMHLLACWSYQKTDNIFTPLLALSVLNLLSALANILL